MAEQRERMTEMFIAFRDALQRSPVPTYAVRMDVAPTLPRPGYLPAEPPQTVRQFQAALGKLGALGLVKVN